MTMKRRTFLFGTAAMAAFGAKAQGLDAIIRPALSGVTDRMSSLALNGPYIVPNNAAVFNGVDARYFFFIPQGVKKARLVVFSHGALADPSSYRHLLFHWASHGFFVAAPVHDDAILEAGPTLRKNTAGAVSQWPVSQLLEDPQAWKSRVDRCVDAMDIAHEVARTSGIELVDDRVAMTGHGYGAYITQLLMGAEVKDRTGKLLRFRDDRFFSGICLSPQGPGIMGLDENSWKGIASPMLDIVAENGDDFTGQDWKAKAQSYSLSAPGYKHLAVVMKAGSTIFTQESDLIPPQGVTAFMAVKAITACFLKSYTDYDQPSFDNMSNDFFQNNSSGFIREYRK